MRFSSRVVLVLALYCLAGVIAPACKDFKPGIRPDAGGTGGVNGQLLDASADRSVAPDSSSDALDAPSGDGLVGSGGIGTGGIAGGTGGSVAGTGGTAGATGGVGAGTGGQSGGAGGMIAGTGGVIGRTGGIGGGTSGGIGGTVAGTGGMVAGAGGEIPRFEPIGPTTEPNYLTGANSDGSVLLGTSYDANEVNTGFLWLRISGIQTLSVADASASSVLPNAVSTSGSVVVGTFILETNRAFRWTAATKAVSLGVLAGGTTSYGADVSADGSVVVGGSDKNGVGFVHYPFRWTQGSNTMMEIPAFDDGQPGWAYGVSDNGNTVVGVSTTAAGEKNAFSWTVGSARPTNLGVLLGDMSSTATDVSGDGSVIVGRSVSATSVGRAFRWSANTGLIGITSSTGWTSASPTGTSSDGTIIVGNGSAGPWVWDPTNGPRLLTTILTGLGANFTGWSITTATAVSRDGKVIVGGGTPPSGIGRSFVVRLP